MFELDDFQPRARGLRKPEIDSLEFLVGLLDRDVLESDARLFLYPERRKDDNLDLSLSGTFRALTLGSFAPLARVRYERNWSTVGIYDFDRFAVEFGVASAF